MGTSPSSLEMKSFRVPAKVLSGSMEALDDWLEWVAVGRTREIVCHDVTSVSSYSRTMTDVECGYNRDGEDLPQFNIGLFCDQSSKRALYFNRYYGSLTDKTNLPYVLENAGTTVGLKDIKFVVDGGFSAKSASAISAHTVKRSHLLFPQE